VLSSVAKLADKTFIIGFLLPAMLGVYAAINLLNCPSWANAVCKVSAEKPFENLTYVALVVWFLAVLLLTLNYTAYRILEGYLPPTCWLSSVKDYHRERFAMLTAERKKLLADKHAAEASAVKRELLASYPVDEQYILPTAFGNRIRAFESYATKKYGADSITVWSRLGAVIPAGFQGQINDARSQVDFFVNVMVLALAIAMLAGVQAVMQVGDSGVPPLSQKATHDVRHLLVVAGAALASAAVAYRWALAQIGGWGELVKSAFDCYLPTLAAQIGYDLPNSEAQRVAFWKDITQLFVFNNAMPEGKWTLAKPRPAANDPAPGTHDGGDD